MAFLQNIKLRYQVAILVSFGILMLVVVQVFYYVKSASDTVRKADEYTLSIIGQIQDKTDNIAENIGKAGFSIAYNPTVQRYMARQQQESSADEVNNLLNSVIQINSNISGISLLDGDGQVLASSEYGEFGSYISDQVKALFLTEAHDKAFFTPVFSVVRSALAKKYFAYIVPVYHVTEELQIKAKIGDCILFCRPDTLRVDVGSAAVTENSAFFIVDSAQRIAVSSIPEQTGQPFDEQAILSQGIAFPQADGDGKYIRRSVPIKNMGWQIFGVTSVYELTSDLRETRNSVILISLVSVVLFLGAGMVFLRSMTRPITQIIRQVQEIGDERLDMRLKTNVTNEIGIIARNINHMLDRIQTITDSLLSMQTKLYQSELSMKEAQFMALESQINPHFLYNTLECIRSMGLEHGVHEIADITSAMAKIFRYSIKGPHTVQVREELACMTNYMKIITYRFGDKISYDIRVDEPVQDVRMIKMILQPILENAVNHGLENKPGKGHIEVEGTFCDDHAVFTITDDGVGMSAEELEALNVLIQSAARGNHAETAERRSIGLANIQRRIWHHYGREYGMLIRSVEHEGTTVTIKIPVQQQLPRHNGEETE